MNKSCIKVVFTDLQSTWTNTQTRKKYLCGNRLRESLCSSPLLSHCAKLVDIPSHPRQTYGSAVTVKSVFRWKTVPNVVVHRGKFTYFYLWRLQNTNCSILRFVVVFIPIVNLPNSKRSPVKCFFCRFVSLPWMWRFTCNKFKYTICYIQNFKRRLLVFLLQENA